MSVLFDNVKPGDTVHYRTSQGVTAKGKVVMNRGTHLVLNRGRGSPQVVTDKNYVKHERSGKTVGALLSRLSVQEGSWDKEQAERNDPNYQWNPSKGPAPMLKKLPDPKAKKVADAIKAGNKLSPYKLGEPQMNAAKAFGWVKEEVRSPSDAEYATAKKFMKSKKNADDLQLGGLGVHTKTGNIHVHLITKSGSGSGSHHVISPDGKELREDYMNTEPHKWNYPDKPEGVLKLGKEQKAAMRKSAKVHDALLKKLHGKRSVKEATWQGAEDPYNWDPVMRKQVFDAAAKKNREKQIAKGQPVPHKLDTGRALKSSPAPYRRGMKEDSKDAEGAAERVAKTKKHKKKLHELDSSTLASYVSKAIADRKKSQSGADMARRIHTPERAAYFVDKMGKRAAKRSAGIKTAVAKIASNLPAEPLKAHSDSEGAKHGGWSGMHEAKKVKAPKAVNWQSIETKNFSVYKHSEGGMPLKHHIAILAAHGIPARKSHSPYVGHTALEIPAKHEKKASKILYGENFDPSMISEVSAPGKEAWIKANKQRFIARYGKEKGLRVLYAKAWKDSKTNEARESEWTANQQLAGQTRKKATGHYLVRDGRTLSGPHKPDEAVRAYRGMSDSKGVKIVHVKETHMFDVTRELITEDKIEKAAKLAINLKKKAKGNSHVNTEPALKVPDRTNTGTIEGNPQEQENAKV